jgi:long-subunit fatty acid transport protein
MKVRFYIVMLVVLSVVILGIRVGEASMFEQLAIHTKAMALANTCTADPPSIMAIHYNPAGLTRLEKMQVDVGLAYAPGIEMTSRFKKGSGYTPSGLPYTGDDPVADTETTSHKGTVSVPFMQWMSPIIAPNLGISYQPENSRWTFAYGIYSPFAVGVSRGDGCAEYGGERVMRDRIIYASPTIAYKLTDSLSLGASLGVGYASIGATINVRAPNALTGTMAAGGVISSPYDSLAKFDFLVEDDLTTSFNVGLLWDPVEWFAFGVVYQSESKAGYRGDYFFAYTQSFKNAWNYASSLGLVSGAANDEDRGTFYLMEHFPQRAQAGVMVKPFKKLKLLCDLHWTDWRCMEKDDFVASKNVQFLQLAGAAPALGLGYTGGPRNLIIERRWEQTWHVSYGLEYQLTDKVCIRLGYEPRKTSVPDQYYDITYPITNWDIYGIGVGIAASDRLTIDLAVEYVHNNYHKIPKNTSENLNSSANGEGIIYNPYSGLDYEQETEAFVPAINISYKW